MAEDIKDLTLIMVDFMDKFKKLDTKCCETKEATKEEWFQLFQMVKTYKHFSNLVIYEMKEYLDN